MIKAGKEPAIENYSAPLVFAFVVGVCFLFLVILLAIHLLSNDYTAFQRAQVFSYIGAAILAVVAMVISVWRGAVAQSQAAAAIEQIKRTDEQLRKTEMQLAHTARQIASTELNNMAQLFERGASLVDSANRAKMAAGTSLLNFVANVEGTPFSRDVQNILGLVLTDQVIEHSKPANLWLAFQQANQLAEKNKRIVVFSGLTLRSCYVRKKAPYAANARFERCTFEGVKIPADFVHSTIIGGTFTRCEIKSGWLDLGGSGYDFRLCQILSFETYSRRSEPRTSNSFYKCDFSGCQDLELQKEDEVQDCFYFEDNPPKANVLGLLQGRVEIRRTNHNADVVGGGS